MQRWRPCRWRQRQPTAHGILLVDWQPWVMALPLMALLRLEPLMALLWEPLAMLREVVLSYRL